MQPHWIESFASRTDNVEFESVPALVETLKGIEAAPETLTHELSTNTELTYLLLVNWSNSDMAFPRVHKDEVSDAFKQPSSSSSGFSGFHSLNSKHFIEITRHLSNVCIPVLTDDRGH